MKSKHFILCNLDSFGQMEPEVHTTNRVVGVAPGCSSNSPSATQGEKLEMRNREKGFSLIELLIVVAIILIIAAIAIPNLLQSRQRANESSAAGSLRTINTSEVTLQTTYLVGFAYDLIRLGA